MSETQFCDTTDEHTQPDTGWNEQLFKQAMVEKWHVDEAFQVRVDMFDQEGRRQHEFSMREDWRYVITHTPREDGTEQWRTKSVQIEYGKGRTGALWVHPESTREHHP
jgi:hypothetical protein